MAGVAVAASSTNKADRHDITEILLKAALNTIKPNQTKPKICKFLLHNPWIPQIPINWQQVL